MFNPIHWLKKLLSRWAVVDPPLMAADATPQTIEEGAAELVTRSRLGDQVAMAQMCLVREQAQKGNERAKHALSLMIDYAKNHPYEHASAFGEEMKRGAEADRLAEMMTATMGSESYPKAVMNLAPEIARNDLNKAIVTLANGPLLADDQLKAIQALIPDDEQLRTAFSLGVKYGDKALQKTKEIPNECQVMLRLGYLLGKARDIQAVRMNGSSISRFCADAGWELGEGPDVQS